jgi:hypothetical protein
MRLAAVDSTLADLAGWLVAALAPTGSAPSGKELAGAHL